MASAGIVVYAFGDGANLGYSCNSGFIYPIQKMTTDLANGSTNPLWGSVLVVKSPLV